MLLAILPARLGGTRKCPLQIDRRPAESLPACNANPGKTPYNTYRDVLAVTVTY